MIATGEVGEIFQVKLLVKNADSGQVKHFANSPNCFYLKQLFISKFALNFILFLIN